MEIQMGKMHKMHKKFFEKNYHGFKTDSEKEKESQYDEQIIERGFDDTELYDLGATIAMFTLPRLKEFRKKTNSFPPEMTFKQWVNKIDKMIFAFEYILNRDSEHFWKLSRDDTKKEYKKYKKGMKLFSKYFDNLWW